MRNENLEILNEVYKSFEVIGEIKEGIIALERTLNHIQEVSKESKESKSSLVNKDYLINDLQDELEEANQKIYEVLKTLDQIQGATNEYSKFN